MISLENKFKVEQAECNVMKRRLFEQSLQFHDVS